LGVCLNHTKWPLFEWPPDNVATLVDVRNWDWWCPLMMVVCLEKIWTLDTASGNWT
jgi:hypothetical protein